jgi:hypothetical protein
VYSYEKYQPSLTAAPAKVGVGSAAFQAPTPPCAVVRPDGACVTRAHARCQTFRDALENGAGTQFYEFGKFGAMSLPNLVQDNKIKYLF